MNLNAEVSSIADFFQRIPTMHRDGKIRIDRRQTIEIGWRSVQDKHGNATLIPCAKRVEKIARFVTRNGNERWAQTESGDTWPIKPHEQQSTADFRALGH